MSKALSKVPKIVSIAGGTGRYSVLKGLKYRSNITALFNITDSGGSSGVLRVEHGILPPGDGIQALAALSPDTDDEKFLSSRFFQGSVNGHRIGNFMYLSASDTFGSDLEAIKYLQKIFKPLGEILPVSTQKRVDLVVRLADGSTIIGEHEIDIRKKGSQIIDAKLSRKAKILPDAQKAISEAEIILFGPGDLWTSTIPHLLIDGLPQAIRKSQGKKIMVCNLATKPGETDGYKASDFARVLTSFLGCKLDGFIVNSNHLSKNVKEAYLKFKQKPVLLDDNVKKYTKNVLELPLCLVVKTVGKYGPMKILRHHPQYTAEAILNIWQGK